MWISERSHSWIEFSLLKDYERLTFVTSRVAIFPREILLIDGKICRIHSVFLLFVLAESQVFCTQLPSFLLMKRAQFRWLKPRFKLAGTPGLLDVFGPLSVIAPCAYREAANVWMVFTNKNFEFFFTGRNR